MFKSSPGIREFSSVSTWTVSREGKPAIGFKSEKQLYSSSLGDSIQFSLDTVECTASMHWKCVANAS